MTIGVVAAAATFVAALPRVGPGSEGREGPAGERAAQVAQLLHPDAVAFAPTKSRSDSDLRDRLADCPTAVPFATVAPLIRQRSETQVAAPARANHALRARLCRWLI